MPGGFQKTVAYDDVLSGPDRTVLPLDKGQPGANTVPVATPTQQTISQAQQGYMEDGVFTMQPGSLQAGAVPSVDPLSSDNAPYLNRLQTKYGFGGGNQTGLQETKPSASNLVNDLLYELTKQVYVYPEDLGSNPELLNWVQIEMYEYGGYGIESQQRDANDNQVFGINLGTLPEQLGTSAEKVRNAVNTPVGIAATNIAGALTIGSAATQVVTSGMAAKLGQSVWNNFSFEPQYGTQQFGFSQETTGFTTANKKVNKTVCLYMPSSLKASYGAEYAEEDYTPLVTAIGTVKVAASTLSNLIKGAPQNESLASLLRGVSDVAARHALTQANDKLSSIASPISGGGNLNLDKAFSATTRTQINPFIINQFKNAKRRSFDFSFRFLPRSKQEVLAVYNIITTLKKHSLPKRAEGKGGRILEYPAEFKIKFFHNGVENLFLPKIARCALKDVSVSYGDEPFTTFAPMMGENGQSFGAAPTKIDMALTFEELEILTQERVDQGY